MRRAARDQLGGVRAAAEAGVDAGLVEDPVLVDRFAETLQVHGEAGLAAEIGLLVDVGHAADEHVQEGVGPGGRGPALVRGARGDQPRGEAGEREDGDPGEASGHARLPCA